MVRGYNKADGWDNVRYLLHAMNSKSIADRPCVFLSHKKEDKPACRRVAEYFQEAEIDYYLDELDETLQQAASSGNVELIIESLKKGIRESTHMLVVVSEKTIESHWVPFEIGYGHAAIVDVSIQENKPQDKIKLAVLTLKDISEIKLPDFMDVAHQVRGIKGLNEYISRISGKPEGEMANKNLILKHHRMSHPLDNVLNWEK
ncbi:MAG TPA: toll/interleukin-1 receptor domain-containing protein [Flavisolibacter sp.]|jgi:hypothetical protein|nr:toll/interleukin-1 receptor domain-containing protein [Flavisolibacter sp.]